MVIKTYFSCIIDQHPKFNGMHMSINIPHEPSNHREQQDRSFIASLNNLEIGQASQLCSSAEEHTKFQSDMNILQLIFYTKDKILPY